MIFSVIAVRGHIAPVNPLVINDYKMKTARIIIIIAFAALSAIGFGGVRDCYFFFVWAYAAMLLILLFVAGPKSDRLFTNLIWILVCVSLLLPVWRWGRMQEWRANAAERTIDNYLKK